VSRLGDEERPFRPPWAVKATTTRSSAGGLLGRADKVAAETFRIIDEDLKNPMTGDGERAYRLFDRLL
jgi:hypothetical protein